MPTSWCCGTLETNGALLCQKRSSTAIRIAGATTDAADFPRHQPVVHRHGKAGNQGQTLRQQAQKPSMTPSSSRPGAVRLEAMINNRPDWCVSRQRFWACR